MHLAVKLNTRRRTVEPSENVTASLTDIVLKRVDIAWYRSTSLTFYWTNKIFCWLSIIVIPSCQFTRSFASFLLSHIGLLSLVVGYCIMGAFIFEELEKVNTESHGTIHCLKLVIHFSFISFTIMYVRLFKQPVIAQWNYDQESDEGQAVGNDWQTLGYNQVPQILRISNIH